MANSYFDEEEFNTKFDGHTLRRILGLTRPHLKWVTSFCYHCQCCSEGFARPLSEQKIIIDEGIEPKMPCDLFTSCAITAR